MSQVIATFDEIFFRLAGLHCSAVQAAKQSCLHWWCTMNKAPPASPDAAISPPNIHYKETSLLTLEAQWWSLPTLRL